MTAYLNEFEGPNREWAETHLPEFKPAKGGSEGQALCELHADKNPSLHVWLDKPLGGFKCQACKAKGNLAEYADQTGKPSPPFKKKKTDSQADLVAEYFYVDLSGTGNEVLKIQRIKKNGRKEFPQLIRNGAGWKYGGLSKEGSRTNPLYKADLLQKAQPGTTVFLVEGEKCVEALLAKKVLATTAPGGANKFHLVDEKYLELLRPLDVVVLPDNDDPGHQHAQQVVRILDKMGMSCRIQALPDLKPKGDIYDWLNAGHTIDDLHQLVAGAAIAVPELEQEPQDDSLASLNLPNNFPPGLQLPRGYRISQFGCLEVRTDDGWRKALEVPCVITQRFKNLEDGSESTMVAHLDAKAWHEHSYLNEHLANGTKAAEQMSRKGYAVTTSQGRNLENYLLQFRLRNERLLAVQQLSSKMGWQGKNNELGFLLGRELVGGPPSTTPTVQFVSDEGVSALADGFACKGSLTEWLEAYEIVRRYDTPLLCLYASFASPLPHILDAHSFFVDVCGGTCFGKTSLLKVCASVWGVPRLDTPQSLIQNWNVTKTAIEVRASALKNLPIFLDDTKIVSEREREMIAEVVYMISAGQGKGRGQAKGGLRSNGSWSTIAISTGETRIRTMTSAGGKSTRILTLWGKPFNGEAQSDVNAISRIVEANYGHAGRIWIEWVIKQRPRWPEWKRELSAIQSDYLTASTSPQCGRVIEYLAIIQLAAELVHECFSQLGALDTRLFFEMLPRLIDEVSESDVPKEALQYIFEWSSSHSARFYGHEEIPERQPNVGGWAGKWNGRDDIAFFRSELEKILSDKGYNPKEVTQRWIDEGWVRRGEGQNVLKKHKLGKTTVRLFTLKREVMEEVCQCSFATDTSDYRAIQGHTDDVF